MKSESNPAPTGRRPYLNDTRQHEVCTILSIGGTRTMAARYVGCSLNTIRRTELRDPSFAQQLRKAEVGTEIIFLRKIRNASRADPQWRAAAWALERLYPERYGRRAPDTITRDQLIQLLQQLGATLAREIPVAADRQRVLARLAKLARPARQPAAKSRGALPKTNPQKP